MTPETAPVEVAAPVVDTPQPIETSSSLSEHVQSFDPQGMKRPDQVGGESADAKADRPERHRAQSQKATAADQPIISELTKQLREAEEAAGIVRKPNESQRVFELRRRVEMATALRDLRKTPAPAPVAAAPVTPPTRPAVQTPAVFEEPEPKLQDFADKDDPYLALTRAAAAWDRRKEAFESKHAQTETQTQEQAQQFHEQFVKWATDTTAAHDARVQALVASDPKAKEIFDGAIARNDVDLTPVTLVAIHTSELGPQMMLALAQDPALADELFKDSIDKATGKPYLAFHSKTREQNPLVALQQRRLLRAVQTLQAPQAGTTGSAAVSRPVTVAPRPLNPVRTAPQTPSESAPRDGSLVDHARSHPYGASPQYRR